MLPLHSIGQAVSDYEKRFGKPSRKEQATEAHQTSTVEWIVRRPPHQLRITMAEPQGRMGILYGLQTEGAEPR